MTNFVYGLLYLVPSNITGDKMANSVNYQHFKTLLNAYEKAYLEKNKNACQYAVAEISNLNYLEFLRKLRQS